MAGIRNRQQGFSLSGWLATILVVGFVVVMTVKLGPLYLDDYAVSEILTNLDERPGKASATTEQVHGWIMNDLRANGIELSPVEFQVNQDEKGDVSVSIDYNRRLPIVANVDLIVSFEHDWKVTSQ